MVATLRGWRTSLVLRREFLPAILEEENGVETPLDSEIDCLLMDFNSSILEHLRGFDPVAEGEDIVAFWPGNPDVFPEANALIMSAYSWVEEGGDRVKFYSAEEEGACCGLPGWR